MEDVRAREKAAVPVSTAGTFRTLLAAPHIFWGSGRKHCLFLELFLDLGSLGTQAACRPALTFLLGPRVSSGRLVLVFQGRSLQLEAEKACSPSWSHSLCTQAPVVRGATTAESGHNGEKARLGSPSSFKEKGQRLLSRKRRRVYWATHAEIPLFHT